MHFTVRCLTLYTVMLFRLTVFLFMCSETMACAGMGGIVVVGCLHGESPVQLTNGQWKKAMELNAGDRVHSYSTELGVHETEVLHDQNRRLNAKRDFIRFRTKLGFEVTVTPEHGIMIKLTEDYKIPWSMIAVSDLHISDFVPSLNGDKVEPDMVISVESISGFGSVQPITKSGTIIVSNVTVSCFDFSVSQSLSATDNFVSNLFRFFDVNRIFGRTEMFL